MNPFLAELQSRQQKKVENGSQPNATPSASTQLSSTSVKSDAPGEKPSPPWAKKPTAPAVPNSSSAPTSTSTSAPSVPSTKPSVTPRATAPPIPSTNSTTSAPPVPSATPKTTAPPVPSSVNKPPIEESTTSSSPPPARVFGKAPPVPVAVNKKDNEEQSVAPSVPSSTKPTYGKAPPVPTTTKEENAKPTPPWAKKEPTASAPSVPPTKPTSTVEPAAPPKPVSKPPPIPSATKTNSSEPEVSSSPPLPSSKPPPTPSAKPNVPISSPRGVKNNDEPPQVPPAKPPTVKTTTVTAPKESVATTAPPVRTTTVTFPKDVAPPVVKPLPVASSSPKVATVEEDEEDWDFSSSSSSNVTSSVASNVNQGQKAASGSNYDDEDEDEDWEPFSNENIGKKLLNIRRQTVIAKQASPSPYTAQTVSNESETISAYSAPAPPVPSSKPSTLSISASADSSSSIVPAGSSVLENNENTPLRNQFLRSFEPQKLDDLVLLNPNKPLNAQDVADCLTRRYQQDQIYTYLGNMLLSVNPYKPVDKHYYNNRVKDLYHQSFPYELSPHLYSLAENVYRIMMETSKSQSIVISGESGAGKTEASKIIMDYMAAISVSGKHTQRVKKAILESNTLLEAFGNAKTLKNENSSRFGKYIDLFFNFQGQMIGGHITSLLLEKQRVVSQRAGERNFHIFYQICSDDMIKRELSVSNAKDYHYLAANGVVETSLDDSKELEKTQKAMHFVGFSTTEQLEIFRIVAGILQLGNIQFKDTNTNNQDGCEVENTNVLSAVANTLQVDTQTLQNALLKRSIKAGGNKVFQAQNAQQAAFNRDTMAKAMYERLFAWLVQRINHSLKCIQLQHQQEEEEQEKSKGISSIGILDIYGFEIFEQPLDNGFDQFTINYVNEKIQQSISKTLVKEQQELMEQGMEQGNANSNLNSLHEKSDKVLGLIEGKPLGIYTLLDEESITSQKDENFLQKLQSKLPASPYFTVPKLTTMRFDLSHFAATVRYHVKGWVSANKDTLYSDMIIVLQKSHSELLQQLFPLGESLPEINKIQHTITNHFRVNLNSLVAKLTTKRQHFVRCLIPNFEKAPNSINRKVLLDQINYLGIVENVILRRNGFHVQMDMSEFLERYKLTCKQTWPHYKGESIQAGCELILQANGITKEKYRFGKTKIYLASPAVIFELDEKVSSKKSDMAVMIQKAYRKWKAKQQVSEIKLLGKDTSLWKELVKRYDINGQHEKVNCVLTSDALILLDLQQAAVLRNMQLRNLKRVYASPLIDGVICLQFNNGEDDELLEFDNKDAFLSVLGEAYEQLLKQPLPILIKDSFDFTKVAGKKTVIFTVNKLFSHTTITLDEENPDVIIFNSREKEDLYDGKKLRRKQSINRKFFGDYLRMQHSQLMTQLNKDYGDTKVLFSSVMSKYNKKWKKQDRIIMITDLALCNVDTNGYLLNRRLPLSQIKSIIVSPFTDDFIVLKVSGENDYLLETTKKTEFVQCLNNAVRNHLSKNLKISIKTQCQVNLSKQGDKSKDLTWMEDDTIEKSVLIPTKTGAEIHVKNEVDITMRNNEDVEMIKDVYRGLKLRRRDSLLQWYLGDYLHCNGNNKIQKLIQKYDNEHARILFSGMVHKINNRGKIQQRKLIITDNTVLSLDLDGFNVNRVIEIGKLTGISVSTMKDNFFVLHYDNSGRDYFMESVKKTEIIKVLCDQFKQINGGQQLRVNVEDKVVFCSSKKGGNTVKTIKFKHDPNVKAPTILPYYRTGGFVVRVNNDLESDYGTVQSEVSDDTGFEPDYNMAQGMRKAPAYGMQDTLDSVYGGRKGRTRASIKRDFIGDYCCLGSDDRFKKLMERFGDKTVLFSAYVSKFNRANKKQERLLVVTDKAIYNIDEEFKLKRRIGLNELEGISVSSFPDGFFCMHCPNDYDYLYESDKKTEIINVLQRAKKAHDGKNLKLNVAERFEYRPEEDKLSSIAFVMDENANELWIEPHSNGLVVHVNQNDPPIILESAFLYIKDRPTPIEVKPNPILLKMQKRWTYKMVINFYVGQELAGCSFAEKIDTVTKRVEYKTMVHTLQPRDERYVIALPERPIIYSLLSKTRVKAKLNSAEGQTLLAIRFVYDVK